MLKRPTRTFVIAAVVLGLVTLVRTWPEQPGSSESEAPPSPIAQSGTSDSAAAPGVSSAMPATASRDLPVAARTAPAPQGVAPIRLRVQAPSDAEGGGVFHARIELEADRGVRELFFTVTFAKSRLALTGWTEGELVRQNGLPVQTNVEEPSDGSIQVAVRVSNGLSIVGAGTLVVLQLEAVRAGTSRITLSDITALGSEGAPEPAVAIFDASAVTIH